MPKAEPGRAHQALMTELHGVVDRFALNGMPAVERIAILAQLIGQEAVQINDTTISAADLLSAVAFNIQSGNQTAVGTFKQAGSIVGLGGWS